MKKEEKERVNQPSLHIFFVSFVKFPHSVNNSLLLYLGESKGMNREVLEKTKKSIQKSNKCCMMIRQVAKDNKITQPKK